MARFKNGALGGFKGRVGNIVGSKWKGQSIMRARPDGVSNPRTDLQQNTRMRFALMGHFLSTQRELVRIGFRTVVSTTTTHNEAMRYNLAHAIGGEFPELFIDFSKVKLSFGDLSVLESLEISAASSKSLSLNWVNNAGNGKSGADDLLILGVYDAESGEGFTQLGAFTRKQETALVQLPDNWIGRTVEVFVFMVSGLALGILNSKNHISSTSYRGGIMLTD